MNPSIKVKHSCTACEESVTVSVEPGTVSSITFKHKRWCPFGQKVDLGPQYADMWIKENGFPMRMEPIQD